jgi:hypothetical protein
MTYIRARWTDELSLPIENDTVSSRHRQPYYREAVTEIDTPRLHPCDHLPRTTNLCSRSSSPIDASRDTSL